MVTGRETLTGAMEILTSMEVCSAQGLNVKHPPQRGCSQEGDAEAEATCLSREREGRNLLEERRSWDDFSRGHSFDDHGG